MEEQSTITTPLPAPERQIAWLRLPLGARLLSAMADGLEGEYGPGLLMRYDGGWLLIYRPEPEDVPSP